MKKSLSFLVALALVFGLFASMAAAADTDLTTAQKYQQLVDNKVLKGTTDGDPHLTSNLTRAEFATIAVAIAGLQEDTASASAFKDVKAGQWWTGAIQAAYNAGLVNGVGNNLFSPKANVTVQEIIKVAVGIAGLTPVADATVDGAAAWAGPYIKAAQDAGLPVPTNYTAAATRGQTIDLAYAVYLSKQVKPLSDVKAVVNADDTITVTGKTAGGVDGVKVAVGTADAAAATLNADGTFTYTTAKQAVGSYDLTVTAYKGDTSVSSSKVSATIDGFTVSSVTVLNGKQIAVKFNKAVQEGTSVGGTSYNIADNATNDANSYFLLAGKDPSNVSVSDDKMTVTLTYASFLSSKDAFVQFEVKGDLKSASGQTNAGYKQAIQLSDSTAPTVTGTTFAGTVATLTFSEPVPTATLGTISVNGSEIGTDTAASIYYVPVSDGLAGSEAKAVEIHGLSVATNYNVYIVGGKDIFGNYFDYNGTINVPNDNVAPTITSLTVAGSVVTVKFSEAVSNPGKAVLSGEADVNGVPASDNLSATYDVSTWLNGATFRNISVKISGYKDLVANPGLDYSSNVSIGLDQTNPTFQAVTTDGQNFVFKFNEELNHAFNTGAPITYKYTNTDGVVFTNQTLSGTRTIGYDANNDNNGVADDTGEWNYLVVDSDNSTTNNVPAGKYEFTISSGAVKDLAGNSNDAANAVITVSGSSSSGGLALSAVYTSFTNSTNPTNYQNLKNNQLVLEFNKELAAANDVSKYQINGSALPSGSTSTFIYDKKHVLVELPDGSIQATGTRTVSVTGLAASDGDTLGSTKSATPILNENVRPVAQSVVIASDTTLNVTFSETLGNGVGNNGTPTGSISGVEVWINGVKSSATFTYGYSNNVLTISTAVANSFNATQSIQVKFVGSNVADMKGNTVADITLNK